jgi:hypothetical protein
MTYRVEILQDSVWLPASSHTLRVDADAQLERFVAGGTPAESLRVIEVNEDENGQA